jgi:arsenate reductase
MTELREPYRVLFLCKHNASRSLMAEAILNKSRQERFQAYSAGLMPSAQPHRYTLEVLAEQGFDTAGLQPKSVQQFLQPDAPKIDMVIGLCQSVQEDGEINGVFPMTAHWHINDTDSVDSTSDADKETFKQVFLQLAQRLHLLIDLPDEKIEHLVQQTV